MTFPQQHDYRDLKSVHPKKLKFIDISGILHSSGTEKPFFYFCTDCLETLKIEANSS